VDHIEEGIKICSESVSDVSILSLFLAKLLLQQNDSKFNDRIIELFENALKNTLTSNIQVWSEYLKYVSQNNPENENAKTLFQRFVKSEDVENSEKFSLFFWYLDEVTNRSSNVKYIRELSFQLLTLFPNDPPIQKSTTKKRSLEDDSHEPNKKQKKLKMRPFQIMHSRAKPNLHLNNGQQCILSMHSLHLVPLIHLLLMHLILNTTITKFLLSSIIINKYLHLEIFSDMKNYKIFLAQT